MSVQPIMYIAMPQPLPSPGSHPGQQLAEQQQPGLYPSLQLCQPPVVSAPVPGVDTGPFVVSAQKARAFKGLGITQVVTGVLSVIFNGVGYHVHTSFTFTAPGIWAGVMFVLSGAFGITAGVTKRKAMVITTMVLAIIGAVLAAVQFSLAVVSMVHNKEFHTYYNYNYYYANSLLYRWGVNYYKGAMAMDGFLVVCAILEAALAISSSALSCCSLCCQQVASSPNPQVPAPVQYANIPYTGGAYYNPQMAYPVHLQQQPGFANYPPFPHQSNCNQMVPPPENQGSAGPGFDEAPSAPTEGLKVPN